MVYSIDLYFIFFFFKQKTAYEMRISDWSSDVCSSDLQFRPFAAAARTAFGGRRRAGRRRTRLRRQRYARPGSGARGGGRSLSRDGRRRGVRDRAGGLLPAAFLHLRRDGTSGGIRGFAALVPRCPCGKLGPADRKSVVWGQKGSVRGEYGG